jgi:hypothetical protein
MENKFNHQDWVRKVLIVSCGLCFVGHGAWGVITKKEWIPFFAVFGIPEQVAWDLMPLTGVFDIVLGLSFILFPTPAALAWMVFWTITTAFLRPLSGLNGWEVVERGGNFGPPLALMILYLGFPVKNWLSRIGKNTTALRGELAHTVMRISLSMLLLGHGAFQLFVQKTLLINHWNSVVGSYAGDVSRAAGAFEILLAFLVLVSPVRGLLAFVLVWKLGTELLYPIAGRGLDTFEFIERWGDYGLPVALMLLPSALRLKDLGEIIKSSWMSGLTPSIRAKEEAVF